MEVVSSYLGETITAAAGVRAEPNRISQGQADVSVGPVRKEEAQRPAAVPMPTAGQAEFLRQLLDSGHLVETGVAGVYGHSDAYEHVRSSWRR